MLVLLCLYSACGCSVARVTRVMHCAVRQILVPPTTAHTDLLTLVDTRLFSDVVFRLDNSAGLAFEPLSSGGKADDGSVLFGDGACANASDGTPQLDAVFGHTWLLSARSSRFEAMLSSGMLEASSKQVCVLVYARVALISVSV
jgi:hypothetical protein